MTRSLPEYPCGTVTEELSDGSVRSHSVAAVSFLSSILETGEGLRRYYLSPKACKGILRRSGRIGKNLPPLLEEALLKVASRED